MSRAAFGLLAIWCLGCTSFDVLIEALVQGQAGCAGCTMADDASALVAAGDNALQASSPSDSRQGCGCDHCVAVQADGTEVSVAPQATPETVQRELGSALSVDREPIVPPPIVGIAT